MSAARPGPLGRSVVVALGAEAPAAWAAADRVVVDASVLDPPGRPGPHPVVARLHTAFATRTPTVIELGIDPALLRTPPAIDGRPWELGPDLEIAEDRLHHLIWANSWDARGDEPVWWWGVKAARLDAGAAVVDDGGPGDIVGPDGARLWVDGGPREPWAAEEVEGLGVVHRESVGRGRLLVAPAPVEPSADLAPDQRAAVAHRRGPARVIAPAGSGKTRVLTERLRHLVVDRRWEPESILAVAYNVKARDEMVERTEGLGVRILTLNGLAHRILAEHRGQAPPVLDEREVRRLLDPLTPPRRHRANTDPIAAYLEALTEVRLGLRDPAEVEAQRGDVPGFAELVAPYRDALDRRGAVDFDEQVTAAIEALLGDGALRRSVQERTPHLLVDEFQDLTPAHLLLLRLVAGPTLDVFGVGDDDQVIYGHAGADPRFLIDFDEWFPGGGSHPLEVNHRCAAPIVAAATNLLAHNHRRVPKVIAARPDAPDPPDGVTIVAHGPSEGASALVDTVTRWLAEGVAADDIAVLTRVHALLLAPRVALAEAGVAVRATVGAELLERTGSRAALAYLRIAADPDALAPADLAEVYRRPSRGLPQWITKWFRRPMTLAELAATAERIDDPKVADKVRDLAADLAVVGRPGRTTRQILETVRDEIGLGEAMAGLDRSKGGEGSSQLDDLEALIQVADLHPELDGFEAWLRGALGSPRTASSAVTLSTVHRVKGREWPRVIVAGVTAGLAPHRLAADIEEERRVLHVAVTRARDKVAVLGDASRPSPFLAELDGSAPVRPPRAARPSAPAPAPSGGRARREGGRAAAGPALEGGAAAREQALRAWRRQRSADDGVPAYVVGSDATLRAIAERNPGTRQELAGVTGIGPAKLERYGEEILAVVAGAAHEG